MQGLLGFFIQETHGQLYIYIHIYCLYPHLNQKARVAVAALWRGSWGPVPFSCWEMPFLLSLLPLLPLQGNTQKPPNKTRPGQPITLFQPLFANKGLTGQLPIWPVTFIERKYFLKGLDLPILLCKTRLWTFLLQKVK